MIERGGRKKSFLKLKQKKKSEEKKVNGKKLMVAYNSVAL